MNVGVVLPHFRETPDAALAVATEADAIGLHGVFCFDHLWPMGQPWRPALAPFPLLAHIATRTERISLGTLVARIGLVPNEILISQFETLRAVGGARVIAGLGTGDLQSAAENEAYGVGFSSAAERREALRACVRSLRDQGFPVWVGAGAKPTRDIAREEGVVLNFWALHPEGLSDRAPGTEITWAGPAPHGDDQRETRHNLQALLAELETAGVTWAVFASPVALDVLGDFVNGRPKA